MTFHTHKIITAELQKILEKHQLWVDGAAGLPANLCGFNLQDVDLAGVNLSGVCFIGANLRNANLKGIALRRADLRGAYLRNTNLQGADLRRADLRGADLRGADFEGVNLYQADLRDADLRGTLFNVSIQEAVALAGSVWLRSDVPWWLGHEDQKHVVLREA